MSSVYYPQKYLELNAADTKQLNVVIKFEGTDTLFSLMPLYKTFRYGDPYTYGEPNLFYGGLVPVPNVKPIISPQSNLNITQKVEPEQGRGSAGTFSIDFIDVDGFMSSFISPGQVFDELLGSKQAQIFIGHLNSSFKEDYICIFRGYVTQTQITPTKITLQFTDANIKRKQQSFYTAKAKLTTDITNIQTSITVDKTDSFIKFVTGPNGLYDSSLRLFFRIGDEFLEYIPTSVITSTSIDSIARGQLGSIAASHANGDEVSNQIMLVGNIIDLALKIMISSGPQLTNKKIGSFVYTSDPIVGSLSNGIVLPQGDDADVDYGISIGDYITITGSASNNVTCIVTGFIDVNGYVNNAILTDHIFTLENPTSGVFSVRSKHDVYPSQVGNGLKITDIDVRQWEYVKSIFAFQADCNFQFLIKQPASAKQFIESELLLPAGFYGVTRFGRISIAATKPPLASSNIVTIDINSIIDPQNISIVRGLNNRRYFSEVQYNYDYNYVLDKMTSSQYFINTNALKLFDTQSPLPITSNGLRSENSAQTFINRRSKTILGRYQYAAFEISVKVLFKIASQVEVGDVVILKDNGTLKITNLNTGLRDIGVQLFEVIDRSLDIKSSSGALKLLSVLNYQINDRFASIAPSSLVDTATTTQVRIKDSFGARFQHQEWKKWTEIIGSGIRIRSADFSYDHTVTLLGFDSFDNYLMNISPALPSAPLSNYIVEVAQYGSGSTSELLYAFLDKTDSIVSVISSSQFTVADGSIYKANQLIKIHSSSYLRNSDDMTISSIVGNTITLTTALGFTPIAGDKIELILFADLSGPYKIL